MFDEYLNLILSNSLFLYTFNTSLHPQCHLPQNSQVSRSVYDRQPYWITLTHVYTHILAVFAV